MSDILCLFYVFSFLFFSFSCPFISVVLRKMGMQRTKSRARAGTGPDSLAQNMLNPYDMMAGKNSTNSSGVVVRKKKSGGVHGWWKGFDSKFMKPMFGGANPQLQQRRRGGKSVDMDHLRGGADVNIGSTGNFESERGNSNNGNNKNNNSGIEEENRSLVNSNDDDIYNPPSKDTSEDVANLEHPEDIF
jgi:hypothetical protein